MRRILSLLLILALLVPVVAASGADLPRRGIPLARPAFENPADGTVSAPPARDSGSIGDIRSVSKLPADRQSSGSVPGLVTQDRPLAATSAFARARIDALPGACPRLTWRLPVTHLPRPGL
ncbi:MAG TPA: hypothetical protein PLP29_03675 [Candidatus Ozemobacteraceae bacterium]|nr:hypothetical protein [Candidatus Ozemobacteraceae bacterium]